MRLYSVHVKTNHKGDCVAPLWGKVFVQGRRYSQTTRLKKTNTWRGINTHATRTSQEVTNNNTSALESASVDITALNNESGFAQQHPSIKPHYLWQNQMELIEKEGRAISPSKPLRHPAVWYHLQIKCTNFAIHFSSWILCLSSILLGTTPQIDDKNNCIDMPQEQWKQIKAPPLNTNPQWQKWIIYDRTK